MEVTGRAHGPLVPERFDALYGDDPFAGALFMDCEASGLKPGSVPVEVAVARSDGWVEGTLVRPSSDWMMNAYWDPAAARIHNIPLESLMQAPSVEEVVAWLDALTQGVSVLSDNPAFEAMWMDQLYRAVGRRRPFDVLNWSQLIHGLALQRNLAAGDLTRLFDAVAARFPAPHRAVPDALRTAMIARAVSGAAMDPSAR